jgi:glucokinase
VPATINSSKGVIYHAPNLPFLDGVSLPAEVSGDLGIEVVADNDATLAALGESWLGATAGFANSVCVTLGTGVGGGLLINGEVFRGPDGTAGEIGHICVEPDGLDCGCGSNGCLEQYASATALVRIASELGRESEKGQRRSAAELFKAGMEGDVTARAAFERCGSYLGIALAGLVNVLNTEAVVIGGGMSAGWELFIGALRSEIDKRAFREPAERVKLFRTKLGDDAGILGAARLALLSQTQKSKTIV